MAQRTATLNEQKVEILRKHAKDGKGLTGALAAFACSRNTRYQELWQALETHCRKSLLSMSAEELLSQDLMDAFTDLAGKEMAGKLREIYPLLLNGPFSHSPWRRSYRSKSFVFYIYTILDLMGDLIWQSMYDPAAVSKRLCCSEAPHRGFEYLLALEIHRGNEEILAAVRDSIMGENAEILLTREIIDAIVISGHEELLDDLIKLLLAARLQEGLRQQILEAADKGSIQTLTKFLKVCLDYNLFRYSAAIRAFDVWSGLGFGDNKPARIQQYAQLACTCLTDEDKRVEYAQSESNIEAYFALWALGSREFSATVKEAERLLDDERHYRKILGWLFVSRTDSSRYQMLLAARHLEERDEELLAWITGCLTRTHALFHSNWRVSRRSVGKAIANPDLPESKAERADLFRRLKALNAFIGNKKRSFSGNPFDFVSITLDNSRVIDCMISLAGYDMDNELTDELLDLAPSMNVEQRQTLICTFLQPDDNEKHRDFLLRCLNDRSILVKELTVDRLSDCKLGARDLNALADGLRSKSSSYRALILSVFKKQEEELLLPLIRKMLVADEESQNQAAIELIHEAKSCHPEWLSAHRAALDALSQRNISTQTQILLDSLLAGERNEIEYTPENGYGLYDPEVVRAYLASLSAPIQKAGLLARVFRSDNELYTAKEIKSFLPTQDELDRLLARMESVFTLHANDEFEVTNADGSRVKGLFGDPRSHMPPASHSGLRFLNPETATADIIPYWSEFREALGEYAVNIRKALGLFLMACSRFDYRPLGIEIAYAPFYRSMAELDPSRKMVEWFSAKYNRLLQMQDLLLCLPRLFDSHEAFSEILKFYRSMVALWGEENLSETYWKYAGNVRFVMNGKLPEGVVINNPTLFAWRRAIRWLPLTEEEFAQWFSLEYRLEQGMDAAVHDKLRAEDYFRAYGEGIIPKDVLFSYLTQGKHQLYTEIRFLSNPGRWPQGRKLYETYPFAGELVSSVLNRIVTVEEKRGELRTPVTGICLAIERIEGARHFCNLLAALGKESFFRGYEYSMCDTKKAVLSRLLKLCYPAKTDTAEALAALLKETDISDKRLAEAVMYAPQWAGFAEKILAWPGLKSGVWFFHAHINELFSAEKETETAIFSPISPQQFNDGAFDKNWFYEAYEQLGEKRFQILYKSAKYITAGSNQHRRSQLYSDAVLGRLDAKELLKEIEEKRNQEKLRCYPLIPIAPGDSEETLRRYEFIQKFLKESRKFGAQRRESEKKACATALENLAITTGLMDVNRLMWQMESRKIDQIRPMLEPIVVDGVSLRLHIDENGDVAVLMEQSGKTLKSPPKAIAKDDEYLARTAAVRDLKELKRRSRESLERAMMECTVFRISELQNIYGNPILAPMLKNLVWTDGAANGFLRQTEDGLILLQLDGSSARADALRIAHPHDLKTAGQWAQFMAYLYENKLVQPFKQVFREYYPITEDERLERTLSRRYEGHQVQPMKTVALLKGRGWTVDYEEGLQKVFYKENLIVRIFAMADWFSPADIEPPTLETVEFFDRRSGDIVLLEDVPPILFSETMRDLDLVVSIAHVGGVDPESSHSTVEMRMAIAAELIKLLKLENVSWIGSHAKIHGKLANYSVHMGSGVVHAESIGTVQIIPVHSQSRGRIFLPFADNDPKTAEIMSKILLLAEDGKIKDPTILCQIRP